MFCKYCNREKEDSHFKPGNLRCRSCRTDNQKRYTRQYDSDPVFRTRLIWYGIKKRCYNPKSKDYKNYGGRGVRVHPSWYSSFDNFLTDMGPRPSPNHSIDRIDVNGNYEPGNCRWVTRKEQMRNRVNTLWVNVKGKKFCIKDLSETSGINYHTLKDRISRNDSASRIFRDPVKSEAKLYRFNGKDMTLRQISDITGMNVKYIRNKYRNKSEYDDKSIKEYSHLFKENKHLTRKKLLVSINGKDISLEDLSSMTGIHIQTLIYRYKRGCRYPHILKPTPGLPSYEWDKNIYTLVELSLMYDKEPKQLFDLIYRKKIPLEEAIKL